MQTTVYLIRHSEKMHLPYGYTRIQPLTVNGERKAEALLEIAELRNADAAYCSPYARTVSTLRYIAEADGLTLTLEERLREMNFGGRPPEPRAGRGPGPEHDLRARQWVDRDLVIEDGESINQCCERMRGVISEIVRQNPGKKILIGTHGVAVCACLSGILDGIDDDYCKNLPQPAVFRLLFEDDTVTEAERLL